MKNILSVKIVVMTKLNSKFKSGDLVRSSEEKNLSFEGDITKWSYKLCTILEIIIATMPIYPISYSTARQIEAFLSKVELTMEQDKNDVRKKNYKKSKGV